MTLYVGDMAHSITCGFQSLSKITCAAFVDCKVPGNRWLEQTQQWIEQRAILIE
jgi:hypothetical protein